MFILNLKLFLRISDLKEHISKLLEKELKKARDEGEHYAKFLEKELNGDGYCIDAFRERYEKHFKGGK